MWQLSPKSRKRVGHVVLVTFTSLRKHLFLTFHPCGIELSLQSGAHRANQVTKNITRHYDDYFAWIRRAKEIKLAHRHSQSCTSILLLWKWRHSAITCLTHANVCVCLFVSFFLFFFIFLQFYEFSLFLILSPSTSFSYFLFYFFYFSSISLKSIFIFSFFLICLFKNSFDFYLLVLFLL